MRTRRRERVWEYSCCIVVKTHKVFENLTNEKFQKAIKMKQWNNFQQTDEANMKKKSFSLFDLLYCDWFGVNKTRMVILTIENQYRYMGHHTCHDRSPVCQTPTRAARMQGLIRNIMQPMPFVFGMFVNNKNLPIHCLVKFWTFWQA